MKRLKVLSGVAMMLMVILAGADFISDAPVELPAGPKQCGYTIIEAGRALNCYGDTIVVEKIHPHILAMN